MAEDLLLASESRDQTGKGIARRLRAVGRIPAVVYGKGKRTTSISIDPRALDHLLHKSGAGLNTLIDLEVGGSKQKVLLKELQREPVSGAFLHADFFQIDFTQQVMVSVPLHYVGKCRGVELSGGILDHPVREVEVECLPSAIPEYIEVDVTALDIGESLHVEDLTLPEGVEMKTDGVLAVAAVVPPKSAEAEEEPQAEEPEETPTLAEDDD